MAREKIDGQSLTQKFQIIGLTLSVFYKIILNI